MSTDDDTPTTTTTTDDGPAGHVGKGAYSEITRSITEKAEETQQLEERAKGKIRGGAVLPPFDPAKLAKLLEVNTTHAKCVYSKARNVAGYGLEIVPHPDIEDPDETQREVAENFWFGADSTWQVGPVSSERSTPADVLEMGWIDYEGIGWLSLEVLTTMDGTPIGLAYVPAMTVRRRKDEPGYAQLREGRITYYGAFGDRYRGLEPTIADGAGDEPPTVTYETDGDADEAPQFVDAESGDSGPDINSQNQANELIFKRNHSPLYTYYGAPDIIPGLPTIEADDAARDFNIDFFENNAVPRLAIIVEGGELTQGARQDIHDLLHGMKDQDHRTVILEVEKLLETTDGITMDDDADDLAIRVEPLTVGINEDASFQDFRDRNEHEILKTHEVPPIEAGQIKSGAFSTDAQAQRKGYIETVIRPKQEAYAQLLYETVHAALGVTDYTIRFKTRGVDTRLIDADYASKLIQSSQGAITVNEAREVIANITGEDLGQLEDDRGNQLLAALDRRGGNGDGGGAEEAERPDAAPPPRMKIGENPAIDVSKDIDMVQFDSSNLRAGLYDYDTRDLYIRFIGDPQDRIYVYRFVEPETWEALKNASSHGSYHYHNIRMAYPYEELTASDWPQQGRAAPDRNDAVRAFLEA
ncbi:phage portal protein [Salinilacihabitans rarus]|uniref:phage portal protein n=1 Tax=Salinilacihabitans rarus TaxID=2961596 RepID=UPI0020C8DFAC|nr:phage portal protein [Salinilacihabitans rarus]